ncbi:NAD(P)/FAD-dependent oxidoreductase [Gracilibacillus salinarum]|uniref:NAD(P)/FAD-dependent oxidoreductase n=1 Tax=Gracilibacillus salinarum TaxID=2932255 RepID=A0ABY4GLT8_9BACI|nr:NAD(P)/FAD-dependent oxidoreductase [Gracilibacillus salinarum]UOQ85331.1 NAD(P)/FAD-dependent oxidoreductase [Gracilibacillus salinarum]
MNNPKIVILGAGYGGLTTVAKLQKKLGVNDAQITLVNKNDYHYESTWLHEAAAGTLHHDRSRVKIADLIDSAKVNFVQDTVTAIKPDEKKVELEDGNVLDYDYLVVALGFEAATFGIPGLLENAFTIGSINKARQIREHIDYQFATYNNEPEAKQERLNIVVGGGGFTGIEFVGELANRVPQLCEEYDIDRNKVRIIVVEAMDSIMPGFDPELIEYAMNSLEARGVEFKLGAFLKEVRAEGITVEQNGEKEDIPTMTTVWAAGVRANHLVEESALEDNRGKVEVTPELRAPSHEDVFVVGDCALVWNKEIDRPYPPTAQIAMQEAEVCAHNLIALVKGGELEHFEFINRGTVCSLGHNDAMGSIFGGKKIFGWTASVMKKVIDNRALFKIGGVGLLLKKGKFNFFS